MKTRTKVFIWTLSLIVLLPILIMGFRFYMWRRDYGQAEPLVQTVWPLARAMESFARERGRSPENLDEVVRYTPSQDFSRVRVFPHYFCTNGPRRFVLRVNARFAFVIDDHFTPAWRESPDVLDILPFPE